MARTKGSPNGRFGSKIDKEEFKNLCKMFCTENEICDFFEVDRNTLLRWTEQEFDCNVAQAIERYSSGGKISLRRAQMRQAETNPAMAIWLGKQYLDQTDVVEQTTQAKIQVIGDVPVSEPEEN